MGLVDRLRARLAAPPTSPPFNRLPPEAFAAFGPRTYIHEPALITNPDRIHLGAGVVIHGRGWLSVVTEHNGRRYDPVLRIGDGTVLGHDLVIACIGEVTIGARVQAADRVFIGDCYHDYRDPATAVLDQPMSDPQPVHIGDGAFLGVNAVILPGVTVGERAYVGAGAVVTRDVAPNTVVAGNPARVIRRYENGEWRPP